MKIGIKNKLDAKIRCIYDYPEKINKDNRLLYLCHGT